MKKGRAGLPLTSLRRKTAAQFEQQVAAPQEKDAETEKRRG